jgi:hypothetical protein
MGRDEEDGLWVGWINSLFGAMGGWKITGHNKGFHGQDVLL